MFESLLAALVEEGELAVRMPNGRTICIGVENARDARLAIRIRDRLTLLRMVLNPSLGVGEAYMNGGLVIERGDLYDLLELATRNLQHLRRKRPRLLPRLLSNDRRRAKRNVKRHYDLSGALYRLFLDADRQYSCAYFPHPGMSLEQAQQAKKRHIAAKLLLIPGCRVLDIGSGWGGLAMTLAEEYGARVLGVTLSEEQLRAARADAEARGLTTRVRFALQDYRDVQGRFDRIVSVGMFEHVGPAHYRRFFETLARKLDPNGVALLHTIGTLGPPQRNNAWIDRYIFPGGAVPSLSQIAAAIEDAGLILTDVEVLRLHYAETLRAWRARFAASREQAKALYDERFCRMWEFYLAGAEAGFRVGSLVVFQLQLAKNRATVPLTRDYITDFDRARTPMAAAAE